MEAIADMASTDIVKVLIERATKQQESPQKRFEAKRAASYLRKAQLYLEQLETIERPG